ncbi:MAG: hypothetical protein OEM62_09950 [Acidobacteriota bacterium]|nr:hypothetical protein [Acidobacteriota bacterium]
MSFVNALLRPVFDGLLYPFRGLAPIWGLLVVSFLTSIGMLVVFKATSNQEALDRVKRGIHAGLFEIRLWNDDMRAIFRAQFEILRHNLSYLRYSLVPMVWIMVPLFFVIAQLHFHYGYRGLEPGKTALLEVEVSEDAVAPDRSKPRAELTLPAGLRAETPAVWSASERSLTWRIGADTSGRYEIGITVDGTQYSKSAVVMNDVRRRSPLRVSGWIDELVYPAESPLASGGAVESIALSYPDREVGLLGWKSHWLVHFFVLTIAFAFLLRKPMGVTI